MSELKIDLKAMAKENAARAALDLVEDGMVLGLGSGSTAEMFVEMLGELMVEKGWKVHGVPTSKATERAAEAAGVPLLDVEHADRIDLAIDGADEVDDNFDLIKGGGGCLLREKIVADAADEFIVIVDESKMVEGLGAFPLPVEVEPFGFTITAKKVFDVLKTARCSGFEVSLREGEGGGPFITDGGHYILDCACELIPDPDELARLLRRIPGVIEHGLFLGMASTVIVGLPRGADILER
jgi:ribose 5-phosphate isomerase A